ncbi:MAG: 4-hydroxy-tetrahydrodipicolinate reductase [Lachnospiraceae bacterium]|nr:4-hydroxy-tetrahydrodipicolinate reductase [Lachnospiraceae bacterium]
MVNIILHGCNGRMGRMVTENAKDDPNVTIVAGVDIAGDSAGDFPVFSDISQCDKAADCVIDFGNASAVDKVTDYCISKGLPLVECTTGLSDEQMDRLKAASEKIAVLKSANMSLGINVLEKVLKSISGILYDAGFDVEIVEKHHRTKLDAPSGTALALADAVKDAIDDELHPVYDRSQVRKKRDHEEIGISAVRGGTIVGDHDVIFAGHDEVITLSHRAYSRAVFAKGALVAAQFLKDKKSGYYNMSDVIG